MSNCTCADCTSRRTPEDCMAALRLMKGAPRLLAALYEALEFAEDQEDVVDGPDGQPQANDAMQLAATIRDAIREATGELQGEQA